MRPWFQSKNIIGHPIGEIPILDIMCLFKTYLGTSPDFQFSFAKKLMPQMKAHTILSKQVTACFQKKTSHKYFPFYLINVCYSICLYWASSCLKFASSWCQGFHDTEHVQSQFHRARKDRKVKY